MLYWLCSELGLPLEERILLYLFNCNKMINEPQCFFLIGRNIRPFFKLQLLVLWQSLIKYIQGLLKWKQLLCRFSGSNIFRKYDIYVIFYLRNKTETFRWLEGYEFKFLDYCHLIIIRYKSSIQVHYWFGWLEGLKCLLVIFMISDSSAVLLVKIRVYHC